MAAALAAVRHLFGASHQQEGYTLAHNGESTRDNNYRGIRFAARQNALSGLTKLLKAGDCDVNEQLQGGWSALMFACGHESDAGLPAVRLLLSAGANVDATDWLGQTALMIAIDSESEHAVAELLRLNADIGLRDRNGSTALHYASKRGLAGVISALLDAGAAINASSGTGDKTPLHCAVLGAGSSGGRLSAVRALLSALPAPDLEASDANGNTALHLACIAVGGEADAIALALVEAGADAFHARNYDGCTPADAGRRAGNKARAAAVERAARWHARWDALRMIQLLSDGRAEPVLRSKGSTAVRVVREQGVARPATPIDPEPLITYAVKGGRIHDDAAQHHWQVTEEGSGSAAYAWAGLMTRLARLQHPDLVQVVLAFL